MDDVYSGGGFSCNFDRPSYQTRAIENYLNNTRNLPDSSLYCRNGMQRQTSQFRDQLPSLQW